MSEIRQPGALGRLNNLAGIRAVDTGMQLLRTTTGLYGVLRAWYLPYLVYSEPTPFQAD